MPRFPSAALLIAVALPAQPPAAARNAQHGAIVANKDGLVLPAGEFTVAELLEANAAFLCRNLLYDPAVVQRAGSFVLQKQLALDALGAEELLAALLAARGLVALPLDEPRGIWQVLPLEDPRTALLLPWRTPDEILRRPRWRELAVTAVDLRHTDARALANALRQHVATAMPAAAASQLVAFAADERLLLLRGYRDQLAGVLQLVQQLERAAAPASAPPIGMPSLQQRVDRLEAELTELRAQLAARRGGGDR